MAIHLKPFNIKVAIIEPGIIDTDMARGIQDGSSESHYPNLHRIADMFAASLKNPVPPTLVADKILDIVEENITVERSSNRKGTLGTVVVQGLVTDLLDAEAIVRENDPAVFDNLSLATV